MDSDFLTSALNGGASPDSSTFDVTPPMAPPGGASPTVPAPQNTDIGAAPDIGAQPAAGQPITTNTPGPAKPAGQSSVWKNIAMGAIGGALTGLAGSAGQTHFGGGAGAGAAAVQQQKQREIENKWHQQQVQFQNVQAAHLMVETSARIHEDERASQEFREREAERQQNVADFLEANGFKPGTSFHATNDQEFHAAATGALPVLASQNNGTIPPTVVISQPFGTGKNKAADSITGYPITAQHMENNPNGARSIVDAYLTASRGYASSDDEWRTGLGTLKANNVPSQGTEYKAQQNAAQQSAVAAALRYFQRPPLPKTEAGKIDSGEVASMSAQFHQELTNYQQRPNADPAITKLLQNKSDSFDELSSDAMKRQADLESQQIQGTAAAQANAAAQTETAKKNADATTLEGRAQLAKQQQDLIDARYRNAAQHQKSLFTEGADPVTGDKLNLSNAPDEFLIDSRTHQPIPTGMLSTLKPTQQESNRADFAQSALHSLDLIDNLRAQGKVPNGPMSGWTAKQLVKAGLSNRDAAEAYGLITLTQSAATGAHVGGRFSNEILAKMGTLLTLNANDEEFTGQERALRDVMTPYAQQGGRVTVGQYKQSLLGSTKSVGGKNYQVTGFDRNGNAVLQAQ